MDGKRLNRPDGPLPAGLCARGVLARDQRVIWPGRSSRELKERGVSLRTPDEVLVSSWSKAHDSSVWVQDRSVWEACDVGPSRARTTASGAMANKGRMMET